ncbi:Lsr2 family protein [Streptomyces sp. NPDC056944]|uniref:histone-like nucleoid-structuring protein Lsr2 n=1 Tax=Streptomyces sp. NPDC056944 TaxID=3345972 RepID=UPI0036378BE2
MAQKTVVILTDDLEGGEADETVAFALDGKSYEIDLSTGNADELRKLLEPYLAAGRKTGRVTSAGRVRPIASKAAVGSSSDTAAIRAWAKENGFEVNERGRVPADIKAAYEKANG